MNEMRLLKFLDGFRGLFERFGVDYPVMRRILQIKLTMDGRRVPTIIGKARKKAGRDGHKLYDGQEAEKNQFFSSLWLYLIFGALSSMFVALGDNFIFQMSLVFGILMFMVMTSLISDFSSVLLDIRDRHILFSKPVTPRTIGMAKTLHIFIYMFCLTGALGVVPFAVGLYRHGVVFALLFVAELIWMDLLIVVFTALMYLAVLKFFDGERLKDLINYVQIGLTIGLALGYQLLFRLFEFVDLQAAIQPRWWQFLVPPVWFGAPYEVLIHGDSNRVLLALSLLALFVPVAAILVYIRVMPSLEKYLQKLADPGTRKKEGAGKAVKTISRLLCASAKEQVFFRFAWTMMGNEREFKLKVYPSLGFSLIFPLIFLFAMGEGRGFAGLPGTSKYLFIYFCALLVPSVLIMLRYSGSYKAAWVYRVLPLGEDVVPIYRGTLIAAIVRLVLPVYVLEAALFTVLFGWRILPDLIVAGLAILVYSVLCFGYLSKALPFSERFETAQQSDGLRTIPLMLLLGGMALVHYAATLLSFGVYIYAALLLAANWVLWQRGFAVKTRG
ncbi:hypothetical protein J25TS5_28570 [Paenibacillus faecis]|uniref:hypothetical protein n=1 Tax=Paenibacillus faecis TaxID=862114 RepID=UPI001B11FD1E|nr:hypothetical protein [Paenibacillus faecis]GIO85925.1 hypothetical protein J25TS5_28570 [Paenibacillus faecis]